MRSAWPFWAAAPRALASSPRVQQPVLQAEHSRVLVGLPVIVAEQVQDPVGAEQVDLVRSGMAGLLGLRRGDLGTNHHVTEQYLGRVRVGTGVVSVRPARLREPQLVHGEG